jgi:multisubunit Na+/H+ antiporter MnhE subunit
MTVLVRIGLLCAVYALTLASADPLDLVAGLLLGAVLLATLRERLPRGSREDGGSFAGRAVAFPLFVFGLLSDIARGTWDVTLRVVHLRPVDHPGIVRIPIGDRTRLGVAVSALATTLSPGSVFIDLDEAAGVMLLHVIDASDPDEVRAAHLRFYERYQRRVFP